MSKKPSVGKDFDGDEDTTQELSRSSMFKLSPPNKGGRRPCLLVIAGPAMGRLFELNEGTATMGRSPDADIIIVDKGISRLHAEVRGKKGKFSLKDLGSTNGLFINGDRVSGIKELASGDRIRVGTSTVLKYSLPDQLEELFQKQMYDSAVRDGLTGAFNKRYFTETLGADYSFAARHETDLSLIMLDIDHFKQVNDTFGHSAGDAVLSLVAQCVRDELRNEDILCRYGGEEFSIILRGTGVDEALTVAERIRLSIAEQRIVHAGNEIPVTVSLGIAHIWEGGIDNPDALVKIADQYLYAAKRAGRNRSACGELGARARATTARPVRG